MARIQLEALETQNAETKKVFSEISQVVETVPAAYRAFGLHSHIVQANWNKTRRVLSEGNLPHSLKESIALAVSAANGCHFCVHIHEKNLLKQGFTEKAVEEIKKATAQEEKINFILQFCVKASKTPEKISNEDFTILKNFQYSEKDILEMLTVMEMYTGYNKIIIALGLTPGE
jgi:uncharacterized peroxidase-related enzyme